MASRSSSRCHQLDSIRVHKMDSPAVSPLSSAWRIDAQKRLCRVSDEQAESPGSLTVLNVEPLYKQNLKNSYAVCVCYVRAPRSGRGHGGTRSSERSTLSLLPCKLAYHLSANRQLQKRRRERLNPLIVFFLSPSPVSRAHKKQNASAVRLVRCRTS